MRKAFELSQSEIITIIERYLSANYEGVDFGSLESKFVDEDGDQIEDDYMWIRCEYEDHRDDVGDEDDDYELTGISPLEVEHMDGPSDGEEKVEKYLKGGYGKMPTVKSEEVACCDNCGSSNMVKRENAISRAEYLKCGNCGNMQEIEE